MSMKPIYLSFTLDLKFLYNPGNSEGVDIQQDLEIRGSYNRGFRRYAVFNWVQKNSKDTENWINRVFRGPIDILYIKMTRILSQI